MKDPFQKAKDILHMLIKHGFEAYIVGGSVRDFLQGTPIHDIDIATSATPDKVISIFPKTFPVGIQHGTVLVRHENENYEVTTFRSESGYKDFRHPDQVNFETSIYKDLARRDFTMNALAMDIYGHIIDPYNGQQDLQAGILRTVGDPKERFQEDPLRMLRATRFIAQLHLKAERELREGMVEVAPYIRHLAIERIREEFTKLLAAPWLEQGLNFLIQCQLMDYLPALHVDGIQLEKVKGESFSHLQSSNERWALFLIMTGCKNPEAFLKVWRFSNKDYNQIMVLIRTFFEQKHGQWDRLTLYRKGIDVATAVERMKVAWNGSPDNSGVIHSLWNELPIHQRGDLAMNGLDLCEWLDEKGGPWTGELLEKIEEAIVMGSLKNDRGEIREWVNHVN